MSRRRISIRNLQIITALDSLSYGLIYRFIAVHLHKLNGSHVTVSIFTIGTLLGDLMSSEITKIFTHVNGNRYGLFFILCLMLLTQLMMAMTNSCWFIIFVRILFSTINRTQHLCLALLLDKEQNVNTREKLNLNYNVLSGSGFILGPIIGGYLFNKEKGFRYISMTAAFLTLMNVILLTTVEPDSGTNNCHQSVNLKQNLLKTFSEKIDDLKKCEMGKNWDMLLLKYLFATSILIFFSKFSHILKHNYENINSVKMGYTIAYINALVFASPRYVFEAKPYIEHIPLTFVSEVAFFLLTILLALACYAPSYECFLLLVIPITFLRTFMMTLWKDLYSERKNEALNKLNNPAGVAAGLTVPLFFGIICNQIAHNAVILFACTPMLMCWAITRFHSVNSASEGERSTCNCNERVKYR